MSRPWLRAAQSIFVIAIGLFTPLLSQNVAAALFAPSQFPFTESISGECSKAFLNALPFLLVVIGLWLPRINIHATWGAFIVVFAMSAFVYVATFEAIFRHRPGSSTAPIALILMPLWGGGCRRSWRRHGTGRLVGPGSASSEPDGSKG